MDNCDETANSHRTCHTLPRFFQTRSMDGSCDNIEMSCCMFVYGSSIHPRCFLLCMTKDVLGGFRRRGTLGWWLSKLNEGSWPIGEGLLWSVGGPGNTWLPALRNVVFHASARTVCRAFRHIEEACEGINTNNKKGDTYKTWMINTYICWKSNNQCLFLWFNFHYEYA